MAVDTAVESEAAGTTTKRNDIRAKRKQQWNGVKRTCFIKSYQADTGEQGALRSEFRRQESEAHQSAAATDI